MNKKYRVVLFVTGVLMSGLAADGATPHTYYCIFNENGSRSAFDRIVYIKGQARRRFIEFSPLSWSMSQTLLNTFDEGAKITTVYKKTAPSDAHSDYWIVQMNLSGSQAVVRYGQGRHQSPKEFEKSYGVTFTPQVFKSYNRSPEWNRYLPPEPHPGSVSFTFIRRTHTCRPLNQLGFLLNAAGLILMQVFSAG